MDPRLQTPLVKTVHVLLTAPAAGLAFIPLTHSVFWDSMASTLIGGTAMGTLLIPLFLPALHIPSLRTRPEDTKDHAAPHAAEALGLHAAAAE